MIYLTVGLLVFVVALVLMQRYMVDHFTQKINNLNKLHTQLHLELISISGKVKRQEDSSRRSSVNKNTSRIKSNKNKPKKMEGRLTLRFKEKSETFDASFFPKKNDEN